MSEKYCLYRLLSSICKLIRGHLTNNNYISTGYMRCRIEKASKTLAEPCYLRPSENFPTVKSKIQTRG